jgi:alcohol dehydrogenase class IV
VLARQAEVARSLGIIPRDTPDQTASKGLTDKLQTLLAKLGLPTRFHEVDISREQLKLVASRFAQRGACLITGQVATENQVISLLEDAL